MGREDSNPRSRDQNPLPYRLATPHRRSTSITRPGLATGRAPVVFRPGFSRAGDIEFSRWGNPFAATKAQFVVQPYDAPGHWQPFVQPSVASSEHGFTWAAGERRFPELERFGAVVDLSRRGRSARERRDPADEPVARGRIGATDGNPVEVIVARSRSRRSRPAEPACRGRSARADLRDLHQRFGEQASPVW